MYVDPITRQTYDYATPITCDSNPRNIIELDPDSDDQDFYILGPEPIKRKPPKDTGLILMLNLINSGTEFSFLNILILHFN